jgi:hypothetical protein
MDSDGAGGGEGEDEGEGWSLIVSVVAVTLSIIVSCALVYMQQTYESKKEAKVELTKFKETMEKYVKPLLQCSTELSDRLFKICEEDYLESWCNAKEGEQFERWQREHYFMCSTLFYFGQYFCWLEIIRRKIRFFQANMQDAQDDYRINAALEDVHTQFSQPLPEYLDTKNYDAKIMRRTLSRGKLVNGRRGSGNAVKPRGAQQSTDNDVKTLRDNVQLLTGRQFRTDADFTDFVATHEAEISLFALPREMQKAIGEVLMVEQNVEGNVTLECMEYSQFNSLVEPLFSEFYLSRWLAMDVRLSPATDLPTAVQGLQAEGIYRPSDIKYLTEALEGFTWFRNFNRAEQTRVRIYQKKFQELPDNNTDSADWRANSKWLQKLQLDLGKLKTVLLGGSQNKKVAAKFRLRVLQNKITDLTSLLHKEFQNIQLGDRQHRQQVDRYDYRLRVKRRATLDKIYPVDGSLEMLAGTDTGAGDGQQPGHEGGLGYNSPPRRLQSFRQRSLSPGRFEVEVGSRRMSAPNHLPEASPSQQPVADSLATTTIVISTESAGFTSGRVAPGPPTGTVTAGRDAGGEASEEECKVEELFDGYSEDRQDKAKKRRKKSERRKSSDVRTASGGGGGGGGGGGDGHSQRQREIEGALVAAAPAAATKADDVAMRPATVAATGIHQQEELRPLSPGLLSPPP